MDTLVFDLAYTRCNRVCELFEKLDIRATDLGKSRVLTDDTATWHQRSLLPIWARSTLQLQSLCRLTSTSDFQAIASVCRSIYELCLDSILIASHDANYAMQQVILAQSDLVDLYRRVSEHFKKKNEPIPDYYNLNHDQVAALLESMNTTRSTYFPGQKRGGHPSRSIETMAKTAEQYSHDYIISRLGLSLLELYYVDYRLLSSFVHSGLSGIGLWSWEAINPLVARSMELSWICCLTCTQAAAEHGAFGDQSDEVLAHTFGLCNMLINPP